MTKFDSEKKHQLCEWWYFQGYLRHIFLFFHIVKRTLDFQLRKREREVFLFNCIDFINHSFFFSVLNALDLIGEWNWSIYERFRKSIKFVSLKMQIVLLFSIEDNQRIKYSSIQLIMIELIRIVVLSWYISLALNTSQEKIVRIKDGWHLSLSNLI